MDASGLNPKFTTHVRELERRVGRGDARCILLHMYYRIHTAYAAFVCGAAAPGHFQLHTVTTARGHGRGGRGGRRASEHSQTKAGIEGMRKRSN